MVCEEFCVKGRINIRPCRAIWLGQPTPLPTEYRHQTLHNDHHLKYDCCWPLHHTPCNLQHYGCKHIGGLVKTLHIFSASVLTHTPQWKTERRTVLYMPPQLHYHIQYWIVMPGPHQLGTCGHHRLHSWGTLTSVQPRWYHQLRPGVSNRFTPPRICCRIFQCVGLHNSWPYRQIPYTSVATKGLR